MSGNAGARALNLIRISGISAVCALFANGCATVVTTGTAAAVATVQRDALRTAAAEVEDVHWPKPETVSFTERLSGIVTSSPDKISTNDAIVSYIAHLHASEDPQGELTRDAQAQLAAAAALVEATYEASGTVRPTMSDIGVVENAIATLRESRRIYLAAVGAVALDDETARAVRRAIKRDFAAALDAVGDAADLLADRVAADRTRTMAQDRHKPARSPSYFADAL